MTLRKEKILLRNPFIRERYFFIDDNMSHFKNGNIRRYHSFF